MALTQRILQAFDPLHRAGLNQVRNASSIVLARRDRGAPTMLQQQDLAILDGIAVSARLFTPQNALDIGPAIVFFHGGGFVLGGMDSHEAMCRRLAQAAGMRVILATYRLAPEFAYPAQIDDAETIVRWVLAHADDLGVDRDRLALGGDSAGGYLAVALTAKLNAERPGAVKAQILFYPLMQLDDGVWANAVVRDSRIVGRMAVRYISAQFAGHPPPSLLGGALKTTPPTVITVGGQMDPVRPDVLAYAAELRAAGVAVTLFEHHRLPHGFGNLTHVSPDARKAMSEVGLAAGEVFAPPAA
ncbi:MAG: hypothetical protein JWP35_3992 [Caulobacter sp.]|nr:hypothetical protein [Caulobacter sp.]